MTKILKVDPINPEPEVLSEAVATLASGGLVAFPTETVYGLGADVFNSDAVSKVFKVKGRPADNPLIVHVDSLQMLDEVVEEVPDNVLHVLKRAWPGPLTVILRKKPTVPNVVTAGLPAVAVRCPAHPVALALIKGLGRPVAAPSANLSGKPSPTTAEHVINDLYGKVDVIIDGGDTFFGVESTVINVLTDPPTLLRPGPIGLEELTKLFGKDINVPQHIRGFSEAEVALSPGMKYRHYAPEKPLVLIELSDYGDLSKLVNEVLTVVNELTSSGFKVAVIGSDETLSYYTDAVKLSLGSRKNLYEVAKNLFKVLRNVDRLDVDVAVVEGFEEKGIGLAIMNRLRKAATRKLIKTY
ncbi:MAG: threonylcarbamoyl-AMP synthase [Zestosphaera tikiterensis]|uniref:Threonylcarbamoyl-AMP synthase n=1 Tax=Zestosphaera tikiterensis TaxID=1973259 RepID=A0A2R7Y8X4_9CREN|nr:MAG: threonylcarbamoyl-AMP synthase [Zestosphaera tikiterensis]